LNEFLLVTLAYSVSDVFQVAEMRCNRLDCALYG
jgi:hypothetical protein